MRKESGDKSFLRLVIPLIALLCAGLLGGLYYWESHKEEIYSRRGYEALNAGELDRALACIDKMPQEEGEALEKEVRYKKGELALEAGDFSLGEEIFLGLGDYSDSAEQALRCRYARAEALFCAGAYEEAMEVFLEAAGYKDALDRYDNCRYVLAREALQSGEKSDAFRRFYALGDYSDAREQAVAIAMELTGEADEGRALSLAQGYSKEQWENREALTKAREDKALLSLTAGWTHVAALTGEGRALAAGSNESGQCNVSGWNGLAAVAAGAKHTLGLTKEGKVLACGDNSYGQCEVESWENVTAIAAGDWDSFALTAAGEILHCGYSDMRLIEGWTKVTSLAAGNCVVAAVRQDGTLLCSFASGRSESLTDLVQCAAGVGWTAGLKRDGTAFSEAVDLSDWENVVYLSCSATLLAGVKLDGTLALAPLGPSGRELKALLQNQTDVKTLALSATFAVLLHTDGSITFIGSGAGGVEEAGSWIIE